MLSSLYLLLLVGGAAVGTLSGFNPVLMIAGTALALISWELLEKLIYWQKGDVVPSIKVPKWAHCKILMTSIGSSLLLAEGGHLVHLSIPIGIVILIVLLIVISINRFYRLSVS